MNKNLINAVWEIKIFQKRWSTLGKGEKNCAKPLTVQGFSTHPEGFSWNDMMALASVRAKTVKDTQIPALVETQVWGDKKKKGGEAKKQIKNC